MNPLTMKITRTLRIWIAVLTVTGSAALAADPSAGTATNPPTPKGAENVVVFAEPGSFAGWPANNGAWTWDGGKEILVGFTKGPYMETEGHNIAKTDRKNLLARSTDGGMTWATEEPANFAGNSAPPVASPGGINFEAPGFAMKVMANGYHGHTDKVGSFFVSDDKGKNWRGPYRFNGLMEDPNLVGTECTARTGYLVTGPESCLIFMAARPKDFKKGKGQATGTIDGGKPSQWVAEWDKSYVAETTDGGKSFHFVSWIAPLNGPFRAVMPAVSRLKDGSIVATVRANRVERDAEGEGFMAGHVDAYGSADNGRTWSFLSRVGETGGAMQNGNPPALGALKDGRIACAYGDRRTAQIKARISSDGGKTWGDELVARDDFQRGEDNTSDMGYPRLVTNHENHLVVTYYWATKDNPQGHIAATIFEP
jgi:hypothetical protein